MNELEEYVMAGYPAIFLETPEEERAIEICLRLAKKLDFKFVDWPQSGNEKSDYTKNPTTVLLDGLRLDEDERWIYCVIDFHPFLKSPNVWRTAKECFRQAKEKGVTYIFISAKFQMIPELERKVVVLDLPLPSKEELKKLAINILRDNELEIKNVSEASEAAKGMTLNEAENAFAISISKCGKLDFQTICSVKKDIICRDGILEYELSNQSVDSIGGLEKFKGWSQKRLLAFSEEAKEYGLPYPKGVLLVGIPGCGKSLSARALANMWNKPLLKLDIGKLFGGIVGDTEANTRKVLKIAEAMSPAILWIDEIEKGLSGTSSNSDSGVSTRMFGKILTWMQEKTEPVFVIATANNVKSLPAEFLRKGRFDEIFFVDLPNKEEREEIFRIQLLKYKRNPENYNLVDLATKTANYTGAEIESIILNAMFDAWNDDKRDPTQDDLVNSIEEVSPMATGIAKDNIEELRKWSKEVNLQIANEATNKSNKCNTRRVVLGGSRL